jgi:CBS domain-containing protein
MIIAGILRDKSRDVIRIGPTLSVADAVKVLTTRRIGATVVTEGERLLGVMSERDVMRALAVNGPDALGMQVAEVMTAPVITIRLDDSVVDALGLMTQRRIRHLPVVDGGELVGIVSIGDLVKARIEEAEQEASALKDYIVSG